MAEGQHGNGTEDAKWETRYMTISGFRNLGPLIGGRQHRVRVDINRGLDRTMIGGIVTLIGANNCGKSNVLKAIETWYRDIIQPEDYTDFVDDPREPELRMVVADGKYDAMAEPLTMEGFIEAIESKRGFELFRQWLAVIEKADESNRASEYITALVEPEYNDVGNPIRITSKTITREQFCQYIDVGIRFLEIFDEDMLNAVRETGPRQEQRFFVDMCAAVLSEEPEMALKYGRSWINLLQFLERYPDDPMFDVFGISYESVSRNFGDRYGYYISQRVFRYEYTKLRDSDLVCDPRNPSKTMLSLLGSAGCSLSMLADAYKSGKDARRTLQKNVNYLLTDIADNFNSLLGPVTGKYSFKVDMDSTQISFGIFREDRQVDIDHQSEGFRWLFDFFVFLFGRKNYLPGDIILIDEYGNMLNYSTVGYLTEVIRNFGKSSGITFVLATQNPMAIDVRHLDEIRLVSPRPNGSAVVYNNFMQVSREDHDILRPVLESLTVGRNYLRPEGRKIIFVIGFTEYFILNGFASELESRGSGAHIDFIPVNGLGGSNVGMAETLEEIRRIEERAVVLVNGDEEGDVFSVYSRGSPGISVIKMPDTVGDPAIRTVPDMFTPAERKKYGIDSGSFDRLACFSQSIGTFFDDINPMTRLRFLRLMKNLSRCRRRPGQIYPRCSRGTEMPISMRMIPPMSSAAGPRRPLTLHPIYVPTKDMAKVTAPMTAAGTQIESSTIASEMPVARASMLVATAKKSMAANPRPAPTSSDPSERDSWIMLAPMTASSANATQWS